MIWDVISKNKINKREDILKTLLKIRGIKSEKEKENFFNPRHPKEFKLSEIGISASEVKKAIDRIKTALKTQEKVFVYGDYDADGVCATAIMWETLFSLGLNVLPYIPERFREGYGLNVESIEKLKKENEDLGLIITVDHGIVADKKVEIAKNLKIDIIITDHHQPGKVKPKSFALIHTTKLSGSGVAYFFAEEVVKKIPIIRKLNRSSLELAALGTIADQLPLIEVNRSIAKYGLDEINKTKRIGLNTLFEQAGIKTGNVGTYEIGYIIAPRINAMGRLGHAIDSLRLICTKDKLKARDLSDLLNKTNIERQKIVEDVVIDARGKVSKNKIIVMAHESYHEGVIGLVAGRIVEEFSRPAIIISKKENISKASARSIPGFNMIEAIRKLEHLIIEGGGHPMAAGFSLDTKLINTFESEINKLAENSLTQEEMLRTLKIDLEIDLNLINEQLLNVLKKFEPLGYGNLAPTFLSKNVVLSNTKLVGKDSKHIKFNVETQGKSFNAIAFGLGGFYKDLLPNKKIDIAYQIDEDTWNGGGVQLKVKDLHLV